MLLIDGVKYEEWTPTSETDFEELVKEHTKEIFGEQSIYLDIKPYLKSVAGIGSIPDGLTIIYGDNPQWHIVEAELSNHSVYEHIVPQVARFTSGIKNPTTQRKLVDVIYNEILKDELLNLRFKKAVAPTEIYKFISDLISNQPTLTIIIEKDTPELEDVRTALAHLQIKVVEFQTFTRAGVGLSVHAHLFQPIYTPITPLPPPPVLPPGEAEKARKVTFQELANTGLIKDGQVLYFHHTRTFNDERAQVLTSSNQLKYESDGRNYSKSELAKILLVKHGFKHDDHGVAGPKYWKTEDGKLLKDLEEQVRSLRGDRE